MNDLRRNNKVSIGVVSLAIFIVLVGILANIQLQRQTIIGISQIYVEPQGREIGDEWTGSFWNIIAAVTTNDDLAGVILPEGQTSTVTVNDVLETLHAGAKVEIKIDPGQPYLIRDLHEKPAKVTTSVGATVQGPYPQVNWHEDYSRGSAGELWVNYYDWGESSWRIYTPYTVSIYKDGSLVGQKTLNTEGKNEPQIVETSEGSVRIENLGTLGGQYLSPNTPAQIAIFKGYPNMYDYGQIAGIINYDQGAVYDTINLPGFDGISRIRIDTSNAYSKYWFGSDYTGNYYRWTNNKHPAAAAIIGNIPALYSSCGGWQQADSGGYEIAKPVAPVIGSSDKTSLPSGKSDFMSLTEYIESRGIANLANTLFKQYLKVEFVTDPQNQQTALKLTIPWSAYGTPVVNFRVPTELADTWVDRPTVSDVSLTAVWQKTQTDTSDLVGSSLIEVTATQNAVFNDPNQAGGSILQIFSNNSKIGLYPLTQTISLKSGESQKFLFEAKNLGVEERADKQPITITASDTYIGAETGRATVYANLIPTLLHNTTILDITAVEKGTSKTITGLQIQVVYPPSGGGEQTKSGFTDNSGQLDFTLDYTPSGAGAGGYQGLVAIQSIETTTYRPSYRTLDVRPGVNEVLLEVELKGETYPEPGFDWTWIIVAIIVGVVLVALIAIYKKGNSRAKAKRSGTKKGGASTKGSAKKWR